MIVKMMLDALDDLVVLMTLAGYENHIVFLCQSSGRLDSGSTVFYDERTA